MWWLCRPPPLELRPHSVHNWLRSHCKMDATRCRALPIVRRASLGGCSRKSSRAYRFDRVRFHLDTYSTTVPGAAA